jgi:hypothetical protein
MCIGSGWSCLMVVKNCVQLLELQSYSVSMQLCEVYLPAHSLKQTVASRHVKFGTKNVTCNILCD